MGELSRWEIVKAACPEEMGDDESQDCEQQKVRQGAAMRKPAYVNCLQVVITKAQGYKKHWPEVMNQNSAAIERDAAPPLQEMSAKALRTPSPNRTHLTPLDYARENKSKADTCFKGNEWRDAAVHYTRAINYTPE